VKFSLKNRWTVLPQSLKEVLKLLGNIATLAQYMGLHGRCQYQIVYTYGIFSTFGKGLGTRKPRPFVHIITDQHMQARARKS